MTQQKEGLACKPGHEFDPWNPCRVGRRDLTSQSCPLTPTHSMWHVNLPLPPAKRTLFGNTLCASVETEVTATQSNSFEKSMGMFGLV